MAYIKWEEVDEQTKQRLEKLTATPRKGYWRKKRIFDIAVSSTALIVLFPFLLVVGLVIFIDDPHGSCIFKQKRIGRHGKPFTLYKFRTMVSDAEKIRHQLKKKNEMNGPVFKVRNDPRVTRVGRFLRQSGIDELPQLANILRGEMSMVGPRPPLPEEVAEYNDYQRLRLTVTPGLTCYWQTSLRRNDVSFAQWVEMDLEYIEKRSMWLDFQLIFRTAGSVIRRDGC